MDDILSIIGISSLVASIVSVILGIFRDILVEKRRFNRQSEAGYLQGQIKVYSQIYFLLHRMHRKATLTALFGSPSDNLRELNDIIKENSSLLTQQVLDNWLDMMALSQEAVVANETELPKYFKKLDEYSSRLVSIIKEIMNKDLIPRYRKVVGETVPYLK